MSWNGCAGFVEVCDIIFSDVEFFCQKKWYEVNWRQHELVLHHKRVGGEIAIQSQSFYNGMYRSKKF
jgi:hypothetical protein